MKTILVFAVILGAHVAASAQTPAIPPLPDYGWKHNLVAGLTLTQVAYTDWAQGGDNALAYTLSADGKSVEDELAFNWSNLYKFAFGQTRLGGQGLRKTDDIIDLSSVYTYKLGAYINPYGAASLKSQFAKGFAYPGPDTSVEVSALFDPAYLTQSVGAGYQPIKQVKTRLGFALREVITSQYNQYTDDPSTPEIEKTTVDGGFESVTNVDWQIDDNILFTTQLELFDPVKHLDEVVVRNTTTITGKVNKYITTVLSIQLINEKRISPRTQIKESLALGLSYTLF